MICQRCQASKEFQLSNGSDYTNEKMKYYYDYIGNYGIAIAITIT